MAVSRAMAKCVIVMSVEMAGHVPADVHATSEAHAPRGIMDEWCNPRRTSEMIVDAQLGRVFDGAVEAAHALGMRSRQGEPDASPSS